MTHKIVFGLQELKVLNKVARSKTVDSVAVLQVREVNPTISTLKISRKLSDPFFLVVTIMTHAKASAIVEMCFTLPDYCITFDSP